MHLIRHRRDQAPELRLGDGIVGDARNTGKRATHLAGLTLRRFLRRVGGLSCEHPLSGFFLQQGLEL